MRNFAPVHGIDFIIDFYAVLGIDRSAGPDEIKSAYRAQAQKWHPDKSSEVFKQQAERMTQILNLAYNVLMDEGKKHAYNGALDGFEEHLISKNGTPIIDIGKRRLDLDFLVSGQGWDQRTTIEAYSQQATGYDENILTVLKTAYEGSPDNPSIRKAYSDMLNKKISYFTMLELIAWEDAGISNQAEPKSLSMPKEYMEKRLAQVYTAKGEIYQAADERALAIGGGYAARLLPGCDNTDTNELSTIIRDTAIANFSTHLDELLKLAEKKAELLSEAVEFTDWKYISQGPYQKLLILLYDNTEQIGMFGFQLQGDHVIDITSQYDNNVTDTSVVSLNYNREIDIVLQMNYVINEYFNNILNLE